MADWLLGLAAVAAAYCGWALLALAQPVHWRRVGAASAEPPSVRRGALLASLALLTSLTLALSSQGPGFGSLLFVLASSAAAVAVTFTLTWKPRWLAPLRPLLSTTEMPEETIR